MAIKDLVDKALLSAFWGNASEKIDARIAAAKASAATPSTAGLVKPGSGLAVASDGTLSAKVDDSTIGFNESGQLISLGGGGGLAPFIRKLASSPITAGNWQVRGNGTIQAAYNDDMFILLALCPIKASVRPSVKISYNNDYPYYIDGKVTASIAYGGINYSDGYILPSGTPDSLSYKALDFTSNKTVETRFYPVGAVISSKE